LNNPSGVAVDSSGNLYIADTYNHVIRKVSGGIITTVAGSGTPGEYGDGISATSALLNWPYGVAIDTSGNLYIADDENGRIRKASGGLITSVASGLILAEGVAAGGGNVYVGKTFNNLIGKVSSGGLTTVAGYGRQSFHRRRLRLRRAQANFRWDSIPSCQTTYQPSMATSRLNTAPENCLMVGLSIKQFAFRVKAVKCG
jgi:hypothetical protein